SQRAFEQARKTGAHSLDGFKNDVPDKAIGNHDINLVFENIAALDVSQKIQISFLAEPKSFASDFRAFHFLGTIAQNADSWLFPAKHFTRINMAHYGKLQKLERFALRRGASIQQDELTFGGRNHGGNRR